MNICCFGELMLRLSSCGNQRLLQSEHLNASFCGAEANVAVSLSILGNNVKFVTNLPNNDISTNAIRKLRSFAVDTSAINICEGRFGTMYLEKGASQRPSKVIYDRKFSSFALAGKDDFNWAKIFDNCDWFHFTGITPALSEELPEICLEACRVAKSLGVKISCDLNYRKTLWSCVRAEKVMSSILPFVDVLFCNEEDVANVLGIKSKNTNVDKGILVASDYTEVAREIYEKLGCKLICTTLRESISASSNNWSAMVCDCLNSKTVVSEKYNINIVDRVGSGDSFAAAMIFALLNEYDLQKAVDFSTAASCLNHSIEGDFNIVSFDEINTLLNGNGNGRISR